MKRMTMKVRFYSRASGDRVDVRIFANSDLVMKNSYLYGFNASYNRFYADLSMKERNIALANNWSMVPEIKPFIGDILRDLAETYYVEAADISYSGCYELLQKEMTGKEVQERVDALIEEI